MDSNGIDEHSPNAMSFVESGSVGAPQVLLIHGAPGDAKEWNAVVRAKKELGSFHCFAVDRPGYGKTPSSARVGDMDEQVGALRRFLAGWSDGKIPLCIVGHSYGAAVAASLACSLREDGFVFAGLILVAGVLDPGRNHSRWYHSLLDLRLVRWVLRGERQRSVLEMKRVAPSLRKLAGCWSRMSIPVRLVHGSEDWIVDFENSQYALQAIGDDRASLQRIEGAGHDLLSSHPEAIAEAIAAVFQYNREGAVSR